MTKKLIVMLVSLTCIITAITACSPTQSPAPATQQSEAAKAPNPQMPQTSSEAITPSPSLDSQNDSALIGEERAKEIALERAGISADGVFFDRVELDRDNGVLRYEVEFKQGLTEYDAEIKADDGSILSWEVDRD